MKLDPSTKIIRKNIDDGRRITIPASFLERQGIKGATTMEIECRNDEFIIRQAKKRCIFCDSDENILEGYLLCASCAEGVCKSLTKFKTGT